MSDQQWLELGARAILWSSKHPFRASVVFMGLIGWDDIRHLGIYDGLVSGGARPGQQKRSGSIEMF